LALAWRERVCGKDRESVYVHGGRVIMGGREAGTGGGDSRLRLGCDEDAERRVFALRKRVLLLRKWVAMSMARTLSGVRV
jgi:hypothetical protein